MSLREIHLACAVEGSYDAHSAVLLRSAAASLEQAQLRVHFLHGSDHPRRSRQRIGAMLDRMGATVTFHEITGSRVSDLPVVDQFTEAMWFRVFLPELLDTDRVLYVDCDAVIAASLHPLWELDLAGCSLAAVTNVFQANHRHRPAMLGLGRPESYFNSGVLLMNLVEMRATGATDALLREARTQGERFEWPDQDALNIVFENRWRQLHPRWNVMNSMRFPQSEEVFGAGEVAEARRQPAIRHFEGPGDNKPWHYACRRDDRELYLAHRAKTPWPRFRPEGAPRSPFRRVIQGARKRVNAGLI